MFDFPTYYHNFSLDNPTVSITVIIWALCIGLAAGAVAYSFSRYFKGKLISKLARGAHNSKESAATLESLSLRASAPLKSALRDGESLRKYVFIANEEECRIEKKKTFLDSVYFFFRREYPPAKYDLSKALLYLPEDKKHVAETRYEQKGSPLLASIICVILFALLAVGLTFCMPKLLELIDSMITAYKEL